MNTPRTSHRTLRKVLAFFKRDVAIARSYRIVYPLRDEPWGVRRFEVEDPNGVVINVMSHKQPSAGGHQSAEPAAAADGGRDAGS